jgi:hypothetical protein
MADGLYFKKPTERDFEFYVVRPGDSLIRIATWFRLEKKLNVEFGLIKLFNGLSGTNIRVNDRLKVPKGKITLVVRKSTFTLHVMCDGISVKAYKVGLGKNDGTPSARFVVGTKTAQPTWYPPESTGLKGPIPAGDPRNLLGSHWIALDHDMHRGLGIHGTTEPQSIGTNSSLGCVRMLNEDVKQLFEMVSPGTEVHVVD